MKFKHTPPFLFFLLFVSLLQAQTIPYTATEGWNSIVSSTCSWSLATLGTGLNENPVGVGINSDNTVIEGAFQNSWTNGAGVDAYILTYFHATNYTVELRLSDGTLTPALTYNVSAAFEVSKDDVIPYFCTGSIIGGDFNEEKFYTPIDFANYTIATGMAIVGARVTLGVTTGGSDISKFVITSNAIACNAGPTAPALSSTTISNICNATTVNLNSITANNNPTNATLSWHTGAVPTAANTIADVTSLAAGTYYAAFYDGINTCYSPTTAVTANIVIVTSFPNVTIGTDPVIIQGVTTAGLSYSDPVENPNQYSLDFDATAEAAGFLDVTFATLAPNQIDIAIPAGAVGTYNANLTVNNSTTGCLSVTAIPISITIQADTDRDGIPDSTDIDDDNDGILDVDEVTNLCSNGLNYQYFNSAPSGDTVTNIPVSGGTTGLATDFDVSGLAFELSNDRETYSIRYTGIINIGQTNTYTFYINSDDGSRLSINGVQVVDYDGLHAAEGHRSGTIALGAGAHSIEILFFEKTGGDSLDIEYSSTSITQQDLPFSILFPCNTDADNDGIINSLDLDSDNDGIPDNIEAQSTTGYIAPLGIDTDTDGLDDAYDTDDGGTAITPVNTDGVDNADFLDTDSDNDGTIDRVEANLHLSGTVGFNGLDNSIDNGDTYLDVNGVFDATPYNDFPDNPAGGEIDWRDSSTVFIDTDGDGIVDSIDIDDDNDGILDIDEVTNLCSNGLNYQYFNSAPSGDTVTNIPVSGGTTGLATNFNVGVLANTISGERDIYSIRYTGIINIGQTNTYTFYINSDDGSRLSINGVQVVDYDGLHGAAGHRSGTIALGAGAHTIEILFFEKTGGDSLDIEYSSSSITRQDLPFSILFPCSSDTDNDGIINSLDLDSDNDGIPDNIEAQTTIGYIAPTGIDTDGDGLDDAYDIDNGGTAIIPVNTDGADTADYLDLDSDNDGAFDISESGSNLTDANADGMIDGNVGVNGLDNTVDNGDAYADVNGSFDATQTNNFTDTDADVLTFGDVDYRDATASGIAMITQIYQSATDRWIEITNVHASNTIEANAIRLSFFSNSTGDQTGNTPLLSYVHANTIAPNSSILIHNATATINNTNTSAVLVSENSITSYAGANDIFVLSSGAGTSTYETRYEEVFNITDTSSYVRNDAILTPDKDFNIEQWTVFVNDGLDPDATPSQRHVLAPLLSEIATANTAANMQLGLHRIGATTRTGTAWSNGFPDRSRQVIVAENFAQSTQLNAKELQINTGVNLTITNNLLVVSDAIVNNGTLRMAGGSQLVQTHSNTANVTGTGQLYIDQTSQTASIYRYDYWSSPVVENGETTYRIGQVMKDGTIPTSAASTLTNINFVGGYNSATTSPVSIASYWLYSFTNGAWNATGNTGTLNPGEGYLLKGPGVAQNYTFSGVPNDGTIASEITENTSKLVGNPYPSALDATKFIQDNTAVLDGSLYFWEHTGEARTSTETEGHNKGGYQGGYATRNITMGVAATTITGTGGLGSATYRVPGRYIAVGQGFFVGATSTGTLTFRNSQRSYQITDGSNSIFFKGSKIQTTTTTTAPLPILKIGLDYTNTKQVKLHRQIGISFKEGNTDGYESGYDSEIYDLNTQDDDIYWNFGTERNYVIAGVGAVQDEVEVPITIQVKSENPLVLFLDAKENISQDIYVYDKVENTKTKLSETGIVLNLDKGTYTNRFYISFNSVALSVDAILENQVAIYYNKNAKELQIKMKSNMDVKKISLWNLLGQEVKSWKGKNLKTSDQTLKLKTGLLPAAVYVVKLQTFTGVVSKKIMVYR